MTFIIDNVVEGSSANKPTESLSLSKRDKHFTVLKCWWSPPTFLDRCCMSSLWRMKQFHSNSVVTLQLFLRLSSLNMKQEKTSHLSVQWAVFVI